MFKVTADVTMIDFQKFKNNYIFSRQNLSLLTIYKPWVATKTLEPIDAAVLTFIGYKQTLSILSIKKK